MNNSPLSDTIADIVESEYRLIEKAPECYGMYYFHARDTTALLNTCVPIFDSTQLNFARFFSYSKKHHLLAVLSTLRLHKVQAFMNLRHVLESGAWAAYAIANRDSANFYSTAQDGMINVPSKLVGHRNAWLDENFPTESAYIKLHKDKINESIGHASFIYTQTVFDIGDDGLTVEMPYFDKENAFHVRADLWLIAATAIQLIALFYSTNGRFSGGLEFASDFDDRFGLVYSQHHTLQAEIQASTEHKEALARVNERPT